MVLCLFIAALFIIGSAYPAIGAIADEEMQFFTDDDLEMQLEGEADSSFLSEVEIGIDPDMRRPRSYNRDFRAVTLLDESDYGFMWDMPGYDESMYPAAIPCQMVEYISNTTSATRIVEPTLDPPESEALRGDSLFADGPVPPWYRYPNIVFDPDDPEHQYWLPGGIIWASELLGMQDSDLSADLSADLVEDEHHFIEADFAQMPIPTPTPDVGYSADIHQDINDFAPNYEVYQGSAWFFYRGNGHTGGTVPADHRTLLPGAVTLAGPGNMTRAGHTFGGWRNGSAIFQAGTTWHWGPGSAGHYFFYAHWVPVPTGNVGRAHFRGNGHTGGSVPADITVNFPSGGLGTISLPGPGTMIRRGYTFGGWRHTSSVSSVVLPPGTNVGFGGTSSLAFYAHWISSTVTVHFVGNGNTAGFAPIHREVITPGSTQLPGPGSMTRTNHTFTGWRDGNGHVWQIGSTVSFGAGQSGTWTVFANWVRNDMQITFRGNGATSGSPPTNRTLSTPTSFVVPSQFTLSRTGFTFNGWRDTTGANWDVGQTRNWPNITSGSWTLDARWSLNPPTINNVANNQQFARRNITVNWNAVPAADVVYTFGIRCMHTMGVLAEIGGLRTTSFTLSSGFFVPGRQYRIAVSATSGGITSWSQRYFRVETPVQCPPRAGVIRGTAVQYMEMGIGWPLGHSANSERRGLNNISSWFGTRTGGFHIGIDITDPAGVGRIMGAPILAVADGVVDTVTLVNRPGTQGFHISIRSDIKDPATGNLLIFTHHHLRNAPTLREGQRVRRGDVIGFVGNSGAEGSSQGHLHFEVSNSGSTWGPDGGTTLSNRRTWYRVENRVNPRFFYPSNAFVGNLNTWNEVRGARPNN